MSFPSGWERFRMLMALRTRLWARAAGQSPGRIIAFALGMVMFLGWGAGLGFASWQFVTNNPDDAARCVHAVCLGVFLMQVVLGLVSLAVAEFFDVSRLMHLPVGYREVFSAMAVSGVLAPMALMYASPLVGCAIGLEGGGGLLALRLALVVVQVFLGHAAALALNLLFLSFFTRRRLRDLATILASVIGMTFYFGWQLLARGGDTGQIVREFPVEAMRWSPTSWLADVFVFDRGYWIAVEAVGLSVFILLLLKIGASLLRRTFLGQTAAPSTKDLADEVGGRSFLPPDIGAMVRATRKVWMREPQIKAIWIQQTAFLLAPAVIVQLQGPAEPTAVVPILAMMVPFFLPMSHLQFASNLFGLDGRGVTQILLAPVARWRVLVARGIAVGGFFLLWDAILILLVLLVSGVVSGVRSDELTVGAVSQYLRLAPWLFIAVALVDTVLFAVGTITSVYLPARLATPGRRPIQGQRAENTGCSAQMLRMLVFLPVFGLGLVLSVLALAPVAHRFLPQSDLIPFSIDPLWAFLTIPLAFALALGIYAAAVFGASRALLEREERIVRALADAGD